MALKICTVCGTKQGKNRSECRKKDCKGSLEFIEPIMPAAEDDEHDRDTASREIPTPEGNRTRELPDPSSSAIEPELFSESTVSELERHSLEAEGGDLSEAGTGGSEPCLDSTSPRGSAAEHLVEYEVAILDGSGAGNSIHITEGRRVVVGSHPSAYIRVSDGYASREHAEFEIHEGRLFVHDLGSTNGTYVRLEKSTALEEQGTILVGHTRLGVRKL